MTSNVKHHRQNPAEHNYSDLVHITKMIYEGESNENLKYLHIIKYKLLRFSFDSPSYNIRIK